MIYPLHVLCFYYCKLNGMYNCILYRSRVNTFERHFVYKLRILTQTIQFDFVYAYSDRLVAKRRDRLVANRREQPKRIQRLNLTLFAVNAKRSGTKRSIAVVIKSLRRVSSVTPAAVLDTRPQFAPPLLVVVGLLSLIVVVVLSNVIVV